MVDSYNTGKGFAFVTFDRKEDAMTATREMDGATVGFLFRPHVPLSV